LKQYGVIGYPVKHSLSPRIFSILGNLLNQNIDYALLEVEPEKFSSFAKDSLTKFKGCNVTIPYKEAILPYLTNISDEGRAIGACNVINEGIGYNTDYLGVIETFREHKISVKDNPALVYGAGGAAKGVIFALLQAGAKQVFVHNRSPEKAHALCKQFQQVKATIPKSVPLCINTLPPTVSKDNYPVPKKVQFAFDLNYHTKRSPFFEAMEGAEHIGGLDLLLWQALYTWDHWFSPLKNKKELKFMIKRQIQQSNLYLAGFMGAGKTTLGQALANKWKVPFIDLDLEIEKETGMTIPKIFSIHGEEKFREIERDALARVATAEKKVVSLGGGAWCSSVNRQRMLQTGVSLYLDSPFQTLFERIQRSSRPLAEKGDEESLKKLYLARNETYQLAHYRIMTEEKTVDELCKEIDADIHLYW
jgi:shikimate dehydrogenase